MAILRKKYEFIKQRVLKAVEVSANKLFCIFANLGKTPL
jgi:hypothetical protein